MIKIQYAIVLCNFMLQYLTKQVFMLRNFLFSRAVACLVLCVEFEIETYKLDCSYVLIDETQDEKTRKREREKQGEKKALEILNFQKV